jgi:hypothetical protein
MNDKTHVCLRLHTIRLVMPKNRNSLQTSIYKSMVNEGVQYCLPDHLSSLLLLNSFTLSKQKLSGNTLHRRASRSQRPAGESFKLSLLSSKSTSAQTPPIAANVGVSYQQHLLTASEARQGNIANWRWSNCLYRASTSVAEQKANLPLAWMEVILTVTTRLPSISMR